MWENFRPHRDALLELQVSLHPCKSDSRSESAQLWLRASLRLRVKEDTGQGVRATSSPLSRPCFWISGRKFGTEERLVSSPSPRAYFCRAVCLCPSFFDIQRFQTQILHRSSVSHRLCGHTENSGVRAAASSCRLVKTAFDGGWAQTSEQKRGVSSWLCSSSLFWEHWEHPL